MIQRGRAFTFPDIGTPRPRTVSETAEAIDKVMPLPHIAKKRTWKSCNSIQPSNSTKNSTCKKLKIIPKSINTDVLRKTRSNDTRNLNNKDSISRNLENIPPHILWKRIQKGQKSAENNSYVNGFHYRNSDYAHKGDYALKGDYAHKGDHAHKHSHLVNSSRPSTVIKVEQRGP